MAGQAEMIVMQPMAMQLVSENLTRIATSNLTLDMLQREIVNLTNDVNDMFLVICAIITSFMQVGFASLEAGCINSKNVTNIILKNVLDTFICAIFYWLVGYSLAYTDGNPFFGYSGWAGASVSSYSFWVFEFVFASTASTILSGAVAERCSFVTYMAYSSIISGFVYPVASHWAWGEGGWLKTLNFLDFAGCGVVHSLGGVCAFIAAVFLGPRIGRFKDGKVVDKPGHSMSMVGLGGLLLISGFMGFNAGALGHINGRGKALGKIVQNTVLGGSGAAVTVLVLCRLGLVGEKKWAFAITLNGVIAGIVAVCGAVDQYSPFMALVVGAGGCLAFLLVRHIVLKLQVDDPLDAVGVHFGGGFFGLIAGPMFIPNGVIFGLNDASLKQLVVNLAGGGAIVLWSACCSVVLFGSLWISGQLRVSEEQEIRGLDATKHNEPAYPIEGWAIDYPIQISQNSLHKSGSYTLNRSSENEYVVIGPQLAQLNRLDHI
ncbi:putative ammonium transporter 1 [Macrosteles quadrilineatus]|uniref:putative ammonium transporter 1 n=1 Tax=Macrosteles quadrilineatus TaxID=74068 RepID=UPI0023E26182|nr:putative ammonium transporter 1 [Macrosteles quadrilineatus]